MLRKKSTETRQAMELALRHFVRIAKPKRMDAITTRVIEHFVGARSEEPGIKPGAKVSPSTVNKELRCIRCVLRKAHKQGDLKRLPEFTFLDHSESYATFVSEDDFGRLYAACDAAELPIGREYETGDWWRALLLTAICTGWRIRELLTWEWRDCDLQGGRAKLRAKNTKAKKPYQMTLSPLVVEHLRKIRS